MNLGGIGLLVSVRWHCAIETLGYVQDSTTVDSAEDMVFKDAHIPQIDRYQVALQSQLGTTLKISNFASPSSIPKHSL
jgi:hypothetical protein